MSATLTVMFGIPGSGKSTKAKAFGGVVVSPDQLRQDICGDPGDLSRDQIVWEEAYRRTQSALLSGDNVVFDATSLTEESRLRLLGMSVGCHAETRLVVMRTPHWMSLARNEKRTRPIPIDVMNRMIVRYENALDIVAHEGWDRILLCSGEGETIEWTDEEERIRDVHIAVGADDDGDRRLRTRSCDGCCSEVCPHRS